MGSVLNVRPLKKIHILFRLEQEPTAQIRDDKGTTKILEVFVTPAFS